MSSKPTGDSIVNFEESLKLKKIGENVFQNIHSPWTWPGSSTVPGGQLISECALAAYATIDASQFVLDNVQSQFLGRTDPATPVTYAVQRLNTGRRFVVRFVTGSQGGKNVVCATICFASLKVDDTKPALKYSVERQTSHHIDHITLDDLEPKTPLGPFMKFQRLAVDAPNPWTSQSGSASTTTKVVTSACHISSNLDHRPPGHISHMLGILNLSDYHVLDCPTTVSGISVGLFEIGDESRTPTENKLAMFTSLNHSVWFHRHDGFRADEMCYMEAKSSWAHGDGRAHVETRLFGKDDQLIATVAQEAFFVFKDEHSESSKMITKGKL